MGGGEVYDSAVMLHGYLGKDSKLIQELGLISYLIDKKDKKEKQEDKE